MRNGGMKILIAGVWEHEYFSVPVGGHDFLSQKRFMTITLQSIHCDGLKFEKFSSLTAHDIDIHLL